MDNETPDLLSIPSTDYPDDPVPEGVRIVPGGRVRNKDTWRKTFAVPLSPPERELLDRASQAQGMPLATYLRRCALMAAQEQLKAQGEDVDLSKMGRGRY